MGMAQESQDDIWTWLGLRRRPIWAVARPLGGLLAMLAAILFVMALVGAFAVIGRTIVADDATQANLGAGALIVALLGAPFLIWSTVLKHETVRYQKEGLITDRINKAVEQLGVEKTVKIRKGEITRPNIEVRIGAILSLERIAQDSTNHDQGRDHVRVMEILCAYIRQNAPATTARDYPEPDWQPLADNATPQQRAAHIAARQERFGDHSTDSKAWRWAKTLPPPRADIALALKVLGRRTATQRRVEAAWPNLYNEKIKWPFDAELRPLPELTANTPRDPAELDKFKADLKKWRETLGAYSGYRLDLRGTNLQGADLSSERPDYSDAVFSGARFANARLAGANMRNVRLEGADLSKARMEGVELSQATIMGAKLWETRLEGAYLARANLTGARLWGAGFQGAYLVRANLDCADLSRAQFEASDRRMMRLEGADVSRVDLDV
jgi:uncharacterized protein YjbI with pentapeptide repeats